MKKKKTISVWANCSVVCCAAALLFMAGCSGGSNVGLVTGVVTLDDKPLPKATINFETPDARGSSAITDENGRYELIHLRDVNGAIIGKHRVTISTYQPPNINGKEVPELVPKKYSDRKKTELTAEVKKGENEINFDLSN